MNKITALTLAASIAASFVSINVLAAERASAPVQVAGEKVDSGLGDLPHYSKWADPTGKNPMQGKSQAKADDKPAQRQAVQVSRAQ